MIDSEREKLFSRNGIFISIGITEDGERLEKIGVPWQATSYAFNMKLPDVYITPSDIDDEEIMDKILSFIVVGCYIWAPLPSYGFISRFKNLYDLSISSAEGILDLEFLFGLDCTMISFYNSHIKSLEPMLCAKGLAKSPDLSFKCVSLTDCTLDDIGDLFNSKYRFREFIVKCESGTNEMERYRGVNADKYIYREFD